MTCPEHPEYDGVTSPANRHCLPCWQVFFEAWPAAVVLGRHMADVLEAIVADLSPLIKQHETKIESLAEEVDCVPARPQGRRG